MKSKRNETNWKQEGDIYADKGEKREPNKNRGEMRKEKSRKC